jgi:hypothetical protein
MGRLNIVSFATAEIGHLQSTAASQDALYAQNTLSSDPHSTGEGFCPMLVCSIWTTPKNASLCDQDEETIDHLLISCIFARQFWFNLLQQVHIQQLAPQPGATSFMDWRRNANERSTRLIQKRFNSLVVLEAWTLWKHQNRCVFDGAAPCMSAAMTQAEEERKVWELARARGVSYLTAQLLPN